jgi:hypothetical protein
MNAMMLQTMVTDAKVMVKILRNLTSTAETDTVVVENTMMVSTGKIVETSDRARIVLERWLSLIFMAYSSNLGWAQVQMAVIYTHCLVRAVIALR